MEIANMAFHADTPGRLSVTRKRTRKNNLREHGDHLFDESKGKRSILQRYLSDAVKHFNYTEIDIGYYGGDFVENVEEMNCAFQESARDSAIVSTSRNTSSSTLDCNDDVDVGLVREPGDGTELPDLKNDTVTETKSECNKRVVFGAEKDNLVNGKAGDIPNNCKEEKEEEDDDEGLQTNTQRVESTASHLCGKSEKCLNIKPTYCKCNAFTDARKRLKHRTISRLTGLFKLYKVMKMRNKLAKKIISGTSACLTPMKSRTCLNLAFINDQNIIEDTQTGLSCSINNIRPFSGNIGKSTKNNRLDSAFIDNSTDSTANDLDAAFILSYLTDSQNTKELTDQEQNTGMDITDQTGDKLNFAKLESQFDSLYQYTADCSSTFEEFEYYNNGFILD